MTTAISVSGIVDPTRLRASGTGLITPREASSGIDAAQFVTRGPLASSAHRLLGLGAVGSARLGQGQAALQHAFGGDPAGWQQVGTPWIAARSLARPVETLNSQSTSAWLLAGTPGNRIGGRL